MKLPGREARGDRTEADAARRRASIVAAVAGLSLAPLFWLASAVVGWPATEAPDIGASASDYISFYVDEATLIPLRATLAIGLWAAWLVLVVSVVRAACRRLDVGAIFSVALASASTAIYVAAEGVLAWPTIGMTANEISENLDAGVAQAMVLSRDGLHAAGSVLLGIALLVVSWLLARSDLWGHWLLAVVGVLAGVSACVGMIVGPEGFGPGGILVWGIVVAVVVLVGRRRNVPQTRHGT